MKRHRISHLIEFLRTGIWRIRAKELPRGRFLLTKYLRVFMISLREFRGDECLLRASSLTYYSLLALVPVLALIFGVAKGFGVQPILEGLILQKFSEERVVAEKVILVASHLLEAAQQKFVAGAGAVLLFFSSLRVFGSVERAFNSIWGIKKHRTFDKKCIDYLAMMTICPLFILVSTGITLGMTGEIASINEKFRFSELGVLLYGLTQLIPYVAGWMLFTFLYLFLPNTRVNRVSAAIGGFAAGTVYQIVQWAYVILQVKILNYGAVYGSYIAVPLFLIWLHTSWLVILWGAEIAFAHQNAETYEFEADCLSLSYSYKKLLALYVVNYLVKNFGRYDKAWTAVVVARDLEIPVRLLHEILDRLVTCHILVETLGEQEGEVAYQLGRDFSKLTIKDVLDTLEHAGVNSLPIALTKELTTLQQCLQNFDALINLSPSNRLIKSI